MIQKIIKASRTTTTTAVSSSMHVETLIVGGGHAGINLALCLIEQNYNNYLILEQKEILNQWKNQRWKDFQLNTPPIRSLLHGQEEPSIPDVNSSGMYYNEQLEAWLSHIQSNNLNYKENTMVSSIECISKDKNEEKRFVVKTNQEELITCRNVVCCSGENAQPKFPKIFHKINELTHNKPFINIHSKDFQDPNLFIDTEKAILIVGSGQSGMQIANLLIDYNKKVYLCTSKMVSAVRTYRGKDLLYWMKRIGYDNVTNEIRKTLPNGEIMRYANKPFIGSTYPISYFSLARKGVTIFGSLDDINSDNTISIKSNRIENVETSVNGYNKNVDMIREYIAKHPEENDLLTVPETKEPEWEPIQELLESNGPLEISLNDCQGIVWCTGYKSNVQNYLHIPQALEHDFNLRTNSPDYMVSQSVPGLYYIGFPWIHTAISDVIIGIGKDAEMLASTIVKDKKLQ